MSNKNNFEKKTLEENKPKSINPFIIMISVIILVTLATYVVSPGAFERIEEAGKTILVPGSFHSTNQKPLSLLSMFQAIPNGLVGSADIMFLVMLVGGSLEVYNRTGSIDKGISKIVEKSDKIGSRTILIGIMILFALIGGFLGWAEQIIPFIPIIVSLTLALGYDSLVGVAASGLITLISFSASPTNVYTVGIAHEIAGLPMFSGMGARLIVLVVFNLVAMTFILRYASKVKKDPSKSLMKDIDVSSLEKDYSEANKEKMTKNQIISLIVFGVTFIVAIYGVSQLGWSLNDLTAAFIFSGVVAGLICKLAPVEIVNGFLDGAKASFNGAMVIGVARGIQWSLEEGGLVDPLINALSKPLMGLPTWATAIGVFLIIALLNGLIPSGSGKAMAFMPILIPLADLVGITRQTMVLAYQFGDGITNSLWFTYGTLLIFLSLGKVPLKKWYKFVIPIQATLFVIACIFLIIATSVGYGPF
ncbi:YfcC family protein [Senegalia sp. (in: firmicutes)]|uniref:YfcC family protein n=1 Tax=Senegalia sp. (in: firmicutes) TaxID=1924098 RepID=UPI003F96EFB4